ncbi:MAG: hypothetical protein ACTSXQ_03315 [Alphaproteobacteria bacterium]
MTNNPPQKKYTISFDTNSDQINLSETTGLDAFIDDLTETNMPINKFAETIYGSASSIGTQTLNNDLSRRRVISVLNYIKENAPQKIWEGIETDIDFKNSSAYTGGTKEEVIDQWIKYTSEAQSFGESNAVQGADQATDRVVTIELTDDGESILNNKGSHALILNPSAAHSYRVSGFNIEDHLYLKESDISKNNNDYFQKIEQKHDVNVGKFKSPDQLHNYMLTTYNQGADT